LFHIEIVMAMTVKVTVFWNVAPCSLIDGFRRFGRMLWNKHDLFFETSAEHENDSRGRVGHAYVEQ